VLFKTCPKKTIDIFNRYDNLYIKINIPDSSPLKFSKRWGCLMARIRISNDPSGRIVVSFPYDPLLVAKVKTIDGRRWHPVEKHWNFPNRDDILEKIIKVFGENEVQISPALKGTVVLDLHTDNPSILPLEKEGEGGFESGLSPKFVLNPGSGFLKGQEGADTCQQEQLRRF
jgi:hypothetical protein